MSRRRLPVVITICLSLAFIAMGPALVSAQKGRVKGGAPAPGNVTVVGGAASVLVSWTPLPDRGVTYRVLRALDAAALGADLTPPIDVATFEDARVQVGATYFYQVVAVYADGSMGVAAPVGFTFAGAALAQPAALPTAVAKGQPIATAQMPIGIRTPLIPPPGPAPGPPPQGVTVIGSLGYAVLSWQPGHGTAYRVERWLQADPACCRAASPGLSPIAHGYNDDLSLTMPAANTYGMYVYRVTAHHKDGSEGYVDVSYNRPAPQKPTGFTARDAGGGTVALQWQAVGGTTQYRLDGTGIPSTGQVVSGTTATVSGVPAGPGASWKVVAVYPHNFVDNAMASTASAVVRVLPPHSMPWLSKNNGPGSLQQVIAHYAPTKPSGWQIPNTLVDIGNYGLDNLAGVSGFRSWIDGAATPGYPNGQWDKEAVYGNTLDLGVARRTDCFQEIKGPPIPGPRTVCYAAAHGIPPGNPGFDNQDTTHPGAGLGPGFLLAMMIIKDLTGTRFFVMTGTEAAYGGNSVNPVASARLDSEGGKYIPHVCLSCHGGRYNPVTNRVDGASYLPLNPSMLAFASSGDRYNQQEKIRRINQIMMNADPTSAVADYIRGLYNGVVNQPGTFAQVDYVPAGWSQQPGLYRQIVGPYCSTCHLAGPTGYNFATYGNFLANKALIFAAVCKGHTMPHSELQYKAFWTKDTGALYLPGLLAAALGYPSCS